MIQQTKFVPLFQGTISGDEKENMKTMEIKEKAINLFIFSVGSGTRIFINYFVVKPNA